MDHDELAAIVSAILAAGSVSDTGTSTDDMVDRIRRILGEFQSGGGVFANPVGEAKDTTPSA